MKKWEIINKFKIQNSILRQDSGKEFKIEELVELLLENRGQTSKKEKEEFLDPGLGQVTVVAVGIDKKQLKKALDRIRWAIKNQEQIVVFGDYDVDGICGTAILWETLNSLGAQVTPYIPHRIDEGYGLSIRGIENLQSQIPNLKLIITVDNGIVAHEAVEFAHKQQIDVIITDHHIRSTKLPNALAIVYTTKLCGTGVAYLLAQEVKKQKSKGKSQNENHLELVALATIADLVPLTGANRVLTRFGLEALRSTKRLGFIELFKEATINREEIDAYAVGHIIAPRLNAMGRLEYAMDSLRLICTNSRKRAQDLAQILGNTNRSRQQLTIETVQHAKNEIMNRKLEITNKKLLFIAHESYQPGVIGLVAGKLVEEYYRPSIVIAKGQIHSKASARSVSGFNIIEFIRMASDFLVDAGGHPMAAGFTVETAKLTLLKEKLEKLADELLHEDKLTRTLRIDCELPLSGIDSFVYQTLQQLAPFGMGNPEPTFVSRNVIINDMRLIGRERNHVKFKVQNSILRQVFDSEVVQTRGAQDKFLRQDSGQEFKIDAIGFGLGERSHNFHIGDHVDIVYTIDENKWNGSTNLQLKIKDIKAHH